MALTQTSAAWALHNAKKGTGTVNCTGTSATITFKPPLTPAGTSKEKATLSGVTLSGCVNGSAAVTATSVKAIIKGTSTNSCAAFATGTAADTVQFNIKWSGLAPTTVKFNPGTIGVNSSSDGFTASGGIATGSFATSSAGFTAIIGQGLTQLTNCIAQQPGTSVTSIQVTSGTASF